MRWPPTYPFRPFVTSAVAAELCGAPFFASQPSTTVVRPVLSDVNTYCPGGRSTARNEPAGPLGPPVARSDSFATCRYSLTSLMGSSSQFFGAPSGGGASGANQAVSGGLFGSNPALALRLL